MNLTEEQIELIAIIVLIVILLFLIIRHFYLKKKKPNVGKFYKTTDGFFTNSDHITKPRTIVVVDQRTDDQAIAVSKIYSKKNRSGNAYIPDLVLHPEDHPSLTEDSIVGKSVHVAVKIGKDDYKAFSSRDFEPLDDKLSNEEMNKVKKGIGGTDKKNKKTTKRKLKNWKRHFK